MKKLLLIAGIMFFAFNAKAQEMSFDETVKYINDKLTGKSKIYFSLSIPGDDYGRSTVKFDASRNGDVTVVYYGDYGDKSLLINLFKLKASGGGNAGIEYTGRNIQFWQSIVFENNFGIISKNESDLERLYKAFIHLRSLCTKEKDPFD